MKHDIYYLYAITDAINNKIYVGQTVNSFRRWKDHQWLSKNKQEQYIHRAMNKYGVQNFSFEVIAISSTQDDADSTEIELIKQYDSRNPEKGYNVAPGGDHAWNTGLPKEQQPMYGKHHSRESRQKISESNMGKIIVISDEQKKKMSIARTGKITPQEVKDKISQTEKGKVVSAESREKLSKSRVGKFAGENAGHSKLNWEIVRSIRLDSVNGMSNVEIGRKYNLHRTHIRSIVKKETWKE